MPEKGWKPLRPWKKEICWKAPQNVIVSAVSYGEYKYFRVSFPPEEESVVLNETEVLRLISALQSAFKVGTE